MAAVGTSAHVTTYLAFVPAGQSASKKTEVWSVCSRRQGDELGQVRWFGRWRQYSFFPGPETTFNAECLRDIAEFCSVRMKERESGHEWGHRASQDWEDCSRCGTVRRADGRNKPCPGVMPKIGLRDVCKSCGGRGEVEWPEINQHGNGEFVRAPCPECDGKP